MKRPLKNDVRVWAHCAVAVSLLAVAAAAQGGPQQEKRGESGTQPEKEVAVLLSQLRDNRPEVRESAVRDLARTGDPRAVEPLIEVLARDPDANVRRSAAYALGRFRDPRAIEPLIVSLKDERPEVCVNAIFALAQMEEPDGANRLEALTAALSHHDLHVCRAAAVALAVLGDRRAVAPLRLALKDKRSIVRSGAAFALGFLSDQRAVPDLLDALGDARPEVREAVIASLDLLGDPRAVPALQRVARDDPDPTIREQASTALRNLRRGEKGPVQ